MRVWTFQHLQTTEIITKDLPAIPRDWELVNVRDYTGKKGGK